MVGVCLFTEKFADPSLTHITDKIRCPEGLGPRLQPSSVSSVTNISRVITKQILSTFRVPGTALGAQDPRGRDRH